MASDAASLPREAALVLAGRISRLAVVFFAQIVVARKLGLAEYGRFAFVLALSQLLAGAAVQGLASATLRFAPAFAAAGERGLLRGFLAWSGRRAFAAGLLLAAAGALAILALPLDPGLRRALGIGALFLPATALLHLYGARLQVARSAWADLPEGVVRPLLGLGILWIDGGRGGASALWAFGFGAAGALLVAAALARPRGLDVPAELRVPEWRRASLDLLAVSLGFLSLTRAGLPLAGAALGAEAAGVYAAAERVALVMAFVLASGTARLAPLIPPLHAAGDAAAMRALITQVSRLNALGAALAFAAIAAGGPFALSLFGSGFAAAYAPLLILAGGQLAAALAGPAGSVLSMSGHGREVARVYGAAAALHLPLTWVLTKLWGPLGAALSTAGAHAAAQAILAWRARATLGARTPPF